MQLLRSPLQTLAERKAYDTDLEIIPAVAAAASRSHLVTAAASAGHRSQVEVTVTKQQQPEQQPFQDAPINLKRDSGAPPVQVCSFMGGK